jgi:hypothetical protein
MPMYHQAEYPLPPQRQQPDAPPSDLIQTWLPELAEQHETMSRAITAEHEAKLTFEAAFPVRPANLGARGGTDWDAAMTADAAAVRRKHKPDQLAALIAETPQRYGTWIARSVFAGQLVAEWNRTAYESVTAASRTRLADQDRELCATMSQAAEDAVRAAAEVGNHGGDDARLRAAWKPLSVLDEAAEAWRPVRAVHRWTVWQRPVHNGRAWEQVGPRTWADSMTEHGVPTTLGRALSLRDAELRRQFEMFAPATTGR